MLSSILGDTRAADEEGNVNIFFYSAALARWETVLSDVVSVVSCVDQVSVLQDLGALAQASND
jgi:hypothetical protein